MANMEFLGANYIVTTGAMSLTSASTTAYKIIDHDRSTRWESSGQGTDGDKVQIEYAFSTTTEITQILIQGCNFEAFRIFYDGTTANTITLTEGETTTSIWISNTADHLYMKFATLSVDKISILATDTIVANQEKKIKQWIVTDDKLRLTRNPSYQQYKPNLERKQVVHEMSDGGIAVYNIKSKFAAEIDLNYLSITVASTIKTLLDNNEEYTFVPFPTTTSWSGAAYQVAFFGDNSFERFSGNNYQVIGREGVLSFREVAV